MATNETKWTPGPWRYAKTNGSPTHGVHMIAGAQPGYLAEVRDCGSGSVTANAALIAASPDLYAALSAVLDVVENSEHWWMDCPDRGGFDVETIRSALNKAVRS